MLTGLISSHLQYSHNQEEHLGCVKYVIADLKRSQILVFYAVKSVSDDFAASRNSGKTF